MIRLKPMLQFGVLLLAPGYNMAAAELVIVESSSPGYAVSQILSDTETVVLEKGTSIVLISEDGLVIEIEGPFEAQLSRGDGETSSDALAALGRLLTDAEIQARDIGGVRTGDAGFGSFDASADVVDGRDSPWLLHAGMSGAQCLPRNAERVEYWREPNSNRERLVIERVSTGQSVELGWEAGAARTAWPRQLDLVADELYLVRPGDGVRSSAIVVHEVPEAITDNDVASVAWLAARGCVGQARLVLAALRGAR